MTAPPTLPEGRPGPAVEVPPNVMRIELSVKSLLIVGALLAGLWLLLHVVPALMVLVIAMMLAGAMHPFVTWLEQRNIGRILAICIVFGTGAVLTLGLFIYTVPTLVAQVRAVAEQEPKIRAAIAGYLEQSHYTAALAEDIRNSRYTELLKSSSATLLTTGTWVLEVIAYGIAAVFLAFYMMLDRDRLRGALFAVVPRTHHLRLSRVLLNLGTIVGGYLRGQVLTCALMSGFILVLLLACGVPNALAIAVFGGVMDVLPYLGIVLTMGPAVLAAAGQGPAIAATVFALMLAYEELESRVLVPLVYGKALRLPSSVVFFSLILGTTLAGIAGALLALPLAAAVLMLVEELRVELPGETMTTADIAQRQADNRGEREYERRAENMPAAQAAAIAVEISGDRKIEEAETAKALAPTDAKVTAPPDVAA